MSDEGPGRSCSTSPEMMLDSAHGKRWCPGTWQDEHRKSAFQPYKQHKLCTVLTNLQRGNTRAETPLPQETDVNFHSRAGQGEITAEDVDGEKDLNVVDSDGLSALHWASAYGQMNAAALLITSGATIDLKGPEGDTPLLYAASGGHHDVVRLLLSHGANINHQDDVGNTALMYAVFDNHPHCCNELLQGGADITLSNESDETAYTLAAENGSDLALAVLENHLLNLLTPV